MRRRRFLVSVSCVIAVLSGAALAGVCDEARAALEKGEYAKAVQVASKVPESSRDRPKALCVIGDAELAQEHWDAAEKAFRDALALSPAHVPAMTGVGRALTAKGKLDEAGEILGRAVKTDNKDVDAWLAQCANFVARGTPEYLEAGRTNLAATLKLDAKEPRTNRMMVEVLLKLGKVDDAEKAAETYAKADKDAPTAWFLRGLVFEARKARDKAIEAYQRAVKGDDHLLDAHRHLAMALDASDPEHKDAAKTKFVLASARRYAELGGRDKDLLALLERLKALAPAK